MTYRETLLKKFEKWDKRPTIDYRQLALNLGVDYHELDKKYKRLYKYNEIWERNHEKEIKDLKQEIKNLKQDKEIARDLVWDLVEYIDNTDYIEPEALNGKIASIQNYLR